MKEGRNDGRGSGLREKWKELGLAFAGARPERVFLKFDFGQLPISSVVFALQTHRIMSHRTRHSTVASTPARGTAGRASTLGSTQRPGTNELPPYEPLQHPLSVASRDKLRVLANPNKFQANHNLLAEVISCLSEAAAEINEALSSKEKALEKARKARNDEDPAASQRRVEEMEQAHEELQTKVDNMTAQMDKDVRKMIDVDNTIEEMQHTLTNLIKDVSNAATQRTQRSQRGVDEEEYPDFDPTDPTNATQRPLAVSSLFTERVSRARDRYTGQNMTERYSKNNHYVGFKSIVHDVRYNQNEDNPLPPAHLWFREDRPSHGETALGAEDSDDDLQIAKETISTKCPLTLQEFRDPVTSRKCPHSFEREAITSMIEMPSNPIRTEGVKAVQCPVGGCQSILTTSDLHSDPVLKRKIARLQKANRDAEEDSDEEGGNRPHSIASDDDDAMDVDAGETPVQRLKKERLSGRMSALPPASSQRRRGRSEVLTLMDDDENE